MDVERECALTLSDVHAIETYVSDGITSKFFADPKAATAFDWAVEYWRTYGSGKEAPSRDVLANNFAWYEDIVRDCSGAAPSYIADRLKRDWVKREATDAATTLLPEMSNDPMGVVASMREAMASILDGVSTQSDVLVYGEDMEAYRRMSEAIDDRKGAPYPFPEMQAWTGGIRPGELCTFIGRSGLGKSQFAILFALECKRAGWDVYLASLELPITTVTGRMEIMQANREANRVNASEWARGERPQAYVDAIHEAQDEIAAMPGHLVIASPQPENRTPVALVGACKAAGCNVLVIDQLQFVSMPDRRNLTESYGEALRSLKQAIMNPADGKPISCLLLHQMNREGVRKNQGSGEPGKVGSMTDISNSAWVEQISDIVWCINQTGEEAENEVMNLATLKTRNVAPIGWQLEWDSHDWFRFAVMRNADGSTATLRDW